MNGMMCYFPKCVVLQGNYHVRGSNIDNSKLELRVKMKKILSQAFKKNYIVIWSCIYVVGRCDANSFVGATSKFC
jgi:hypothetical protein